MKYTPWFIGIIFIPMIFLIAASSSAKSDADSELIKAKEMYIEAIKGHCETIGERINACYAGDENQCEQMYKSIQWFVSEYKETPEMTCPDPERSFLVNGVT
jgi:hypothetical protein